MLLGYSKLPVDDVVSIAQISTQSAVRDTASARPMPYPRSMLYVLVVVESPASQRAVAGQISRMLIRSRVEAAGGRRIVHRVVQNMRNEVLVAFSTPPPSTFADDMLMSLCRTYELAKAPLPAAADASACAALLARMLDTLCIALATGHCSSDPYLDCFMMPLAQAIASRDAGFAARAAAMAVNVVAR